MHDAYINFKTCGDPETHRNFPRSATRALEALFEGEEGARSVSSLITVPTPRTQTTTTSKRS
jgi:hypothetical protein